MKLFPKRAKLTVIASDGSQAEQADLSGFTFDFEVTAKLPVNKKGKNSTEPVKAVIVVKGLGESTREKLETQKAGVKLEYGYGGELFEIFEGLIINTVSEFEGPGWGTTIYAKHAWEAYKSSYFSKTYEGDTPVKTVVEDVAKEFGLPYTITYDRGDEIIGGQCFDGEAKTVLDELCLHWDLNWRVENNSVIVEDTLNPPLIDKTTVIVLGPSIVSGPQVQDSYENEGKKDEKIVRRISATSILLPQLYPGVPVQFDAKSFSRSSTAADTRALAKFDSQKIYICDTVIHKGSSKATESLTEITTKEEKV